jgi:phosphoglycerate-specific signal transduction histidine kinase
MSALHDNLRVIFTRKNGSTLVEQNMSALHDNLRVIFTRKNGSTLVEQMLQHPSEAGAMLAQSVRLKANLQSQLQFLT